MKKKAKRNSRSEAGLIARQRVHLPWPSHLNYESDDDFYDWYSGEHLPTPDEILWGCIEILDNKLWPEMPVECDGGDDWEFTNPSDISLLSLRSSLAHR